MKKVLVLSYFFLPGNFAGSYRIASFAKYLNKFGYYPVVVTRRWDNPIQFPEDAYQPTGKEIIHEKHEDYEVYYLPYKPNLRDRIYCHYGENRFKFWRKLLSFIEVVTHNFMLFTVPYSNLYYYAVRLLKNEKFDLALASGGPYLLFRFCYKLHRKTGIRWIADYRDEWTSGECPSNKGGVGFKFLKWLYSNMETKWVGTAEAIISVSETWTKSISSFVKKEGFVVMNGYEKADYPDLLPPKLFDVFTIIYNGTLYSLQPVEVFLNAYKRASDNYKNKIEIRLLFAGAAIDKDQEARLKEALKGYEAHYSITGRLNKQEVIKMQMQAHLLLMIGYTTIKGVHSSKIFEYLACKRPIFLCPADNDVLEELVERTNSGYIASDTEHAFKLLCMLIEEFLQTGAIVYNSNLSEIEKYSRQNQAKELARVFDKVLN